MVTFQVQDMTCGHCVSAITRAVKELDTDATLDFDLAAHQVHIDSTSASPERLGEAMVAAGYTPVLAMAVPAARAGSCGARSGKCCCG
jgi:copper chaperone